MVVDRRHRKDSPAGPFEAHHLKHDAQGLQYEDSTREGQQQFLLGHHGDRSERPPERRLPTSPMKSWAG